MAMTLAGSGCSATLPGTMTPTPIEKLMLVTALTLVLRIAVVILVSCSLVTLVFDAVRSFCWALFCALAGWFLLLLSAAALLVSDLLLSEAALLVSALLLSDAALLVSVLLVSD